MRFAKPSAMRVAVAVLDRVADGQNVASGDVDLALQVTGDLAPEYGQDNLVVQLAMLALREGPSDWHEGPDVPRRREHPRAVGVMP